ncbi:MAG: hypothetical protein U9Q81_06345 [Pseudomonadota bacterium]|nr:hypothetical protein [Pseudomonadota bacterium]
MGGDRRSEGRVRRKHAMIAVAARWRDQGGQVVDELQRGERQGCVTIAQGLGQMVDNLVFVDLLDPVEGEPRAGAVTQQPLPPCPAAPADTHRGIEREPAVVPREHVAGVIGIEQTAAGEPAQHPVARLMGDGADLLRCGRDGWAKSNGVLTRIDSSISAAARTMRSRSTL